MLLFFNRGKKSKIEIHVKVRDLFDDDQHVHLYFVKVNTIICDNG